MRDRLGTNAPGMGIRTGFAPATTAGSRHGLYLVDRKRDIEYHHGRPYVIPVQLGTCRDSFSELFGLGRSNGEGNAMRAPGEGIMSGRSTCYRVSLSHLTSVLLVLIVSLVPGSAGAVPANPEAVQTLSQPDGSTFPARLAGDERAHWYEADGGLTIVQDAGGLWCYAAKGPDGQLVSSGTPVGEGSAAIEPHLRPDPSALEQVVGQREQTWAPAGTLASITGTAQAVIILVEFSDTPAGEGSTGAHTPAYFDDPTTGLVLGSDPGRMKNYFSEVSYNQLNVQGVVANTQWHQVAHTEAYYGGDCSPGVSCTAQFGPTTQTDNCNVCIYELARAAVQAADAAGFNFAPYDTDADGVIDHVIIVHAGQNQASLGGSPSDIWSHRWSIPGSGQAVDGKVVKGYMMVSEHDAMSVFAHEFAHDLGAPDLYDYGHESDPVGKWCLMSHNFESERPAHLCGLLKVDLDGNLTNGMVGWATPTLLTTQGTYTAARLDQNATGSVFMTDPVFSGNERFLLENRSQSGFYDYSVPESGILITHADMDMAVTTGHLNEGPPAKAYYCAWVERPLNLASADGAAYSSDDGQTIFDTFSIPNTSANGGNGTGRIFKNIGAEGSSMAFTFRAGPTGVSGSTSGDTHWTLDGSPYVVQSTFTVSDGNTLTIDPGVVIKFKSAVGMTVNGAIQAVGAVGDTIAFTAYTDDHWGGDTDQNGPTTGSAQSWAGITITNPDAACQFTYCMIRWAGYSNSSVLSLTGTGAQLSLRSSCVLNGSLSNAGLSLAAGTNTDISDCRLASLYYGVMNYGTVNIAGTTIQGCSPFAISSQSATATISHCTISSNVGPAGNNAGVVYASGGTFAMDHTVLTNNNNTSGQWVVAANGNGAAVTNCRISNNSGGIYLSGTGCRVVADTLESNTGSGFDLSLLPAEFRDNIATGNGAFGYAVPAPMVKEVWLSNTMGSNGRGNAIGVYTGTISTPTQWVDEHPYAIRGDVTVADGTSLSLEPGSILKFNTNTQLIVYGALVAEGTPTDQIVFTSYRDDSRGGDTNGDGTTTPVAGDWLRVDFNSADAGTSMSDCVIGYAGQQYQVCCWSSYYHAIILQGSGSHVSFARCTVSNTYASASGNSYAFAIWIKPGVAVDMSGVTVMASSVDGIRNEGTLTMTGCRVQSSGRDGIYSTGPLSVRNSRITGNGGQGLYTTSAGGVAVADTCYNNQYGLNFGDGIQPAEFHDNVSYGNSICDYVVPVSEVDDVWLENQSDDSGVIGIRSGSIASDTQWIDDYVYHVYGNLTVPFDKTLTLEPGTVMKFDAGFNMTVNGRLVAEGTQGDEIVFTSVKDDAYGGNTNGDGVSSGVPGDWQQIQFGGTSGTNEGCTMQHCKVRYAGSAHGSGNVDREGVHLASGAHVTMTDCEVERTATGSTNNFALAAYAGADLALSDTYVHHNNGVGIYVADSLSSVVGCLAANNGAYGFYVHPDIVGEVADRDSLSANGNANSISVLGGTITHDDAWPATYPYVINGTKVTVNAGATLVLYKGAVVKFNGDRTLEVKGALVAQGDASEKVIFTSYRDDAYGGDTNMDGTNSSPALGDWRQIYFNAASSASDLGWAVISYGGLGNNPAVRIENCNLTFSECIVHHNLYRGVRVGSTGRLSITNSDIYSNTYGLENQSTTYQVDARNCWWGSATGPLHTTQNPSGLGNQVSNNVLFSPWLQGSIDNPWYPLVSPATSGDYEDVLVFDLDGDPLMDLVAATSSSGVQVFRRSGFESWEARMSPLPTGQYTGLDSGDFDNDGKKDLLACGTTGIRCFHSGSDGSLTEVDAPLAGSICKDAHLVYLDHDQNLDVVGAAGNNQGIWVFHGDGAGHWSPRTRPTDTGSYNRIQVRDLNNDTWNDIVATTVEAHGIRIWYGAADGTWTSGPTIGDGQTFYGLDLGDVDRNGTYDIAVGTMVSTTPIQVYLNDGHGGWTSSPGPTTSGLYYDVKLRDLNGDSKLDMVGANHNGGVNVWLGTSGLFWNYWYYPTTAGIFKRVCIDDFTLNGSPDIAAASMSGLFLWENRNQGVDQEYFSTTPDLISFGPVAIGNCAHDTFQLQNVTGDTLRQVVVYTTNPAFQVTPEAKEVGPFDLLPGETRNLRVTYCPTIAVSENEVVIIHSTVAVTHLRVTGQGVPYISPLWSIPLSVRNAVGGANNSQTVTFGGGIGATDGRDVQAGEVCLPPWPPETVFDARFDITGCDGSLINVHDYYADRDTFLLKWQPGSAGYPMTISWNPATLPEGTFLISDTNAGFVWVDTLNMASASQVVIPAGMEYVTELAITTTRLNNFTYNLNQGWNLVSRPISMEQDSLAVLFPGALSAFGWAGGYQQVQQLGTGTGYWLNMNAVSHPIHKGGKFSSVRKTLPAGWSLVGAVYDTVLVSQILQNPPNSILSVFSFNGHYDQATSLFPGQGYWIDLSRQCEITIEDPYAKAGAGGRNLAWKGTKVPTTKAPSEGSTTETDPTRMTSLSQPWVLPIAIGNPPDDETRGRVLELGFDQNATDGIDPALGEQGVPPLPPSNVFEARFSAEGTNGLYLDLRSPQPGQHEFEIIWQAGAAGYPIRLQWDGLQIPAGLVLTLTDNLNGSFLGPIDMREISEVTIPEGQSFITGVRIRASIEAAGVDGSAGVTRFELAQNVPNPLSSETWIRYALPTQVPVELAVHDVTGRTVRVLARGVQPAGIHNVLWDGRDDAGAAVGAGVYFYRLKAEGYEKARKLLVVR